MTYLEKARAAVVGDWVVAALSQMAPKRRDNSDACQDAFDFGFTREFFWFAAADGVSSATHGGYGAQWAVDAVRHFMERNSGGSTPNEELIKSLFSACHRDLVILSNKNKLNPDAVGTTLQVGLIRDDQLFYGQLGDGFLILGDGQHNSSFGTAGELRSQGGTMFLTHPKWLGYLNHSSFDLRQQKYIFLSTDGLEKLFLKSRDHGAQNDEKEVSAKVVNQFIDLLGQSENLSILGPLGRTLGLDVLDKVCNDDRTIIMCCRRNFARDKTRRQGLTRSEPTNPGSSEGATVKLEPEGGNNLELHAETGETKKGGGAIKLEPRGHTSIRPSSIGNDSRGSLGRSVVNSLEQPKLSSPNILLDEIRHKPRAAEKRSHSTVKAFSITENWPILACLALSLGAMLAASGTLWIASEMRHELASHLESLRAEIKFKTPVPKATEAGQHPASAKEPRDPPP